MTTATDWRICKSDMDSPAQDKRLLLVDDEVEFGEIIERIALKLGFSVCKTTQPSAFQRQYDSCNPTHIVLDMIMPEMDGIELMEWLAQRGCKAKIIVISGYNSQYGNTARTAAATNGLDVVATLSKPFSVSAVRSILSL